MKKGAVEVSVWIEEGVKKAFFSTEYILVHKWSTLFKKGAILERVQFVEKWV